MKNRIAEKLAAVICAICLAVGVMSGVVFARDDAPVSEPEETIVVLETMEPAAAAGIREITDNRTSVPFYIDDVLIGDCPIVKGVPYARAGDFCRALGLDPRGMYSAGVYTLACDGFRLDAQVDAVYFTCNGRCLYAGEGVRAADGQVLLPVEALAKCFSVQALLDTAQWTLRVSTTGAAVLESGDTHYNETDLYWLSRIIYAAAGDETMTGMVAVGSVVLNRLGSEAFPDQDSVYDVIFAKNQFDVVINGMIYMEPSEAAVIAAKIALEGYDTALGATYFGNYDFGDGYECVAWIGEHCFMTQT